jgi:hypothetical protein
MQDIKTKIYKQIERLGWVGDNGGIEEYFEYPSAFELIAVIQGVQLKERDFIKINDKIQRIASICYVPDENIWIATTHFFYGN